ncbi:RibD family protein [Thiohalorhabdus sp. Cl-TMA]|uniref:RibD family protein n=1 Tax=Thiohalorhabdus methylotrophus TaxID=3242694 RepID=A0ABV4TXG5_9GAMM
MEACPVAEPLLRFHPGPPREQPLEGTFLAHDLRRRGSPVQPFVYSNFITSLDGRAALLDPATGKRGIPRGVANERDWRLFMELAIQADALLTSGRHLRAVARGCQTELLDMQNESNADLVGWRRKRGLVGQPLVAAISPDLDIPEDLAERFPIAPILILAPASAPPERAARLGRCGLEVVRLDTQPYIRGQDAVRLLAERGNGIIYSLAGPRILHTLLSDTQLDRLYLTTALTALGGEGYDTLLKGPLLEPPAAFGLEELYLDWSAPRGVGQLFQVLTAGRKAAAQAP